MLDELLGSLLVPELAGFGIVEPSWDVPVCEFVWPALPVVPGADDVLPVPSAVEPAPPVEVVEPGVVPG